MVRIPAKLNADSGHREHGFRFKPIAHRSEATRAAMVVSLQFV